MLELNKTELAKTLYMETSSHKHLRTSVQVMKKQLEEAMTFQNAEKFRSRLIEQTSKDPIVEDVEDDDDAAPVHYPRRTYSSSLDEDLRAISNAKSSDIDVTGGLGQAMGASRTRLKGFTRGMRGFETGESSGNSSQATLMRKVDQIWSDS
eukprot:TRINITY_DN1732_c0_g2_i1.p1 TRINITY_DN1732_c0_g2~~TRINITY_DN1732_c0_g2_i1.p1  ORF type:complete len:151 (-),score=28.16 TRINITY_DN1732_c0_g2_i1:182-634(-)